MGSQQLQLLGTPSLAIGGRSVAVSWPRRSLALLAYLVSARGLVARDTVAFELWPEDDEEYARGNLRRNLNLLRGVFPPDVARWIVSDAGSIGFDHTAADTDVRAFETFAASPATFVDAVDAYGGDFAAPLDEPWVLTERRRLRARFHLVLSELVSASFSARRFDAALLYARRIIADEPLREDILRRVVAIRYAMGDRAGALAEFVHFRSALRRELDVDPMPETIALHALVMRGEPLPNAPDATARIASPAGAPPPVLLPFGGRQAAFQRLSTAWDAAGAGDGSLAFVSGAAGIGKTRIVAELLDRAVGSSARVLRGTTASPEARPFEAIFGALAQTAPFLASIDIEAIWLDVLAPLIPEIGPRSATSIALPAEREVLRIFEAIARLIVAVARARPLVVVLEDVHWAGPGTLAAIRQLATRIRGHRVLVLATYRDDEGPSVETLRRELCASRHAVAVALRPLSEPDALAILAELQVAPPSADAGLLVARSEGNPLFLTELVREYPQSLRSPASGIADVVKARLGRLSAPAQSLAAIAAICGTAFDLDLLRAVLGWDDGTLLDGIAELLERQFIRATASDEGGSYAFTHALVHGAIGDRTAVAEQRRIHHIVARALEGRAADARYAVAIAGHWRAAHEFERASAAYETAAKAALGAHARDEAAALATSGETLTRDPRRRFDLIRIRIEANLRQTAAQSLRADAVLLASLAADLDETARYDAALIACRIEELCGDIEARSRTARVLEGFADQNLTSRRTAEIAEVEAKDALHRGDTPAAISATERALRRYREIGAGPDELRAACFLARLYGRAGNAVTADALLEPLEVRVITSADAQTRMYYWNARASAAHGRYDARAMLAATERLHAAAREVGDRLLEGHAAWIAGTAHSIANCPSDALREIDRAEAIYRSIGATEAESGLQTIRGSVLLQIGRVSQAAELLRHSLQSAQAQGILESEYFAASNLGVACLMAGAAADSLHLQRHALELARRLKIEAFVALALGDLGAAEATLGNIADGVAHLREAAALNVTLHRPAPQAHDLARAARWEPVAATAASYARAALAIVEADAAAVKHAVEILWCCSLAFTRAGEFAAARYALQRGCTLFEQRSAVIEDAQDRRLYSELPHHAALLALREPHWSLT